MPIGQLRPMIESRRDVRRWTSTQPHMPDEKINGLPSGKIRSTISEDWNPEPFQETR